MTKEAVFDDLIDTYSAYYNIKKEDVVSPFDAEAYFANEAEKYVLVKKAKIADVDSYEHVFFALRDEIGLTELTDLDEKAWEEGVSRVKPSADHKNTDVVLVVVCDKIADDVKANINSFKHSKNYRFGLFGYSNYFMVVIEAGSETILTNRRGKIMKDFVQQVFRKD
ncbi:MAG TPA: hypothetical protein DCG85_05930 [Lachnospiraceae bacterium]|nr:hypothetical protein [Lachnospiraceae bacterium]